MTGADGVLLTSPQNPHRISVVLLPIAVVTRLAAFLFNE